MISSQQIIQMIEELAPKTRALDWDNPGLAIGDYSKKISKNPLLTPYSNT